MTTSVSWKIAPPQPEQRDAILALLPRLAAFDLPPNRQPQHLWEGDAALVRDWFAGTTDNLHILCAMNHQHALAGIAMFSLRPELMSDEPSAHLEALAVDAAFEGQGVASALLDACDKQALKLGARSITLHVFETNERARALYQHKGYASELHRCIKWLRED